MRGLSLFEEGRYGPARIELARTMSNDPRNRSYLLDRLRLLMAGLADGRPREVEVVANELYDLLRVQGLNADRTTASVVFNEGVKIWKGEPFEQAQAYAYIAIQKAMLDDWGNARASASQSLFLLKDFGENEKGERKDSLDLVRDLNEHDGALDTGYQPIETNFTLGYMLAGIAAIAMDRPDEARDNFAQAVRFNPALQTVVEQLHDVRTNMVLVVDAGRGPAKRNFGPDGALARFVARTGSDNLPLDVVSGGRTVSQVPVAMDANQLAADHTWINLEDVRVAKSTIGALMQTGGWIVATQAKDDEARLAGLGVLILGSVMRASAQADTRYNEPGPQRTYIVPLQLPQGDLDVTLSLPDHRESITLVGLRTHTDTRAQITGSRISLRYVRLPDDRGYGIPTTTAVRYRNDVIDGGPDPNEELPYILGGRDVRAPTLDVLRDYQSAGFLRDFSLVDLENLYREEGIALRVQDLAGAHKAHVLEGGDSLVPPMNGTAGAMSLFCAEHPPYKGRTPRVRDLQAQLAAQRAEQRAEQLTYRSSNHTGRTP